MVSTGFSIISEKMGIFEISSSDANGLVSFHCLVSIDQDSGNLFEIMYGKI